MPWRRPLLPRVDFSATALVGDDEEEVAVVDPEEVTLALAFGICLNRGVPERVVLEVIGDSSGS